MTVLLRSSDGFAERLLADARDGLAQYRAIVGPLTGPVLDIGAHHGAFTLEALEAGASEVLCVEASLVNYLALVDNIEASDRVGPAQPMRAAVWDGAGPTVKLRRASGGNSGQHSVMFHEGHPVTDVVPVVRFGTLLYRQTSWAYVKIDIEGGEWSLLQRRAAAVGLLMARAEFLDLEIHPLDAPEYYPPTVREEYGYVDEVGAWFREAGHEVTWTVQHPTRLFVTRAA